MDDKHFGMKYKGASTAFTFRMGFWVAYISAIRMMCFSVVRYAVRTFSTILVAKGTTSFCEAHSESGFSFWSYTPVVHK